MKIIPTINFKEQLKSDTINMNFNSISNPNAFSFKIPQTDNFYSMIRGITSVTNIF